MDTDIKINITDLQLRNLAEHIPPEKFHELGLGLGLTVTDLSAINQETADPVTKTFRILDRWRSNLDPFLIRWRNKVDGKETERLKLETALRQSGLDMFIPCIDAHVTRKENGSESGDTRPTVNLSFPYGAKDVDVKQEIEIVAVFSDVDDEIIRTQHNQLYRLISHPTDTDENWKRICALKTIFEPQCTLTNIELLPLRFTVEVVSLDNLNHLKRSIENGQLENALLRVLECANESFNQRAMRLRLELDKQSYADGVRFFKDFDPAASPDYPAAGGATSVSSSEDFNAWVVRKTTTDLPDDQQKGVNLVWRNMSQQNFGF